MKRKRYEEAESKVFSTHILMKRFCHFGEWHPSHTKERLVERCRSFWPPQRDPLHEKDCESLTAYDRYNPGGSREICWRVVLIWHGKDDVDKVLFATHMYETEGRFFHPETGDDVADHDIYPLWLGEKLDLDIDMLREFVKTQAGA